MCRRFRLSVTAAVQSAGSGGFRSAWPMLAGVTVQRYPIVTACGRDRPVKGKAPPGQPCLSQELVSRFTRGHLLLSDDPFSSLSAG